jgi:hypothetical protein
MRRPVNSSTIDDLAASSHDVVDVALVQTCAALQRAVDEVGPVLDVRGVVQKFSTPTSCSAARDAVLGEQRPACSFSFDLEVRRPSRACGRSGRDRVVLRDVARRAGPR